jgi:hypothetical protein
MTVAFTRVMSRARILPRTTLQAAAVTGAVAAAVTGVVAAAVTGVVAAAATGVAVAIQAVAEIGEHPRQQ